MHAKLLSCVRLFATTWTVARQAPLSMGLSRREYSSGLPFPSPVDLPDPDVNPCLLHWQADSLPLSHQGSPYCPVYINNCSNYQWMTDNVAKAYPNWTFFLSIFCLTHFFFLAYSMLWLHRSTISWYFASSSAPGHSTNQIQSQNFPAFGTQLIHK